MGAERCNRVSGDAVGVMSHGRGFDSRETVYDGRPQPVAGKSTQWQLSRHNAAMREQLTLCSTIENGSSDVMAGSRSLETVAAQGSVVKRSQMPVSMPGGANLSLFDGRQRPSPGSGVCPERGRVIFPTTTVLRSRYAQTQRNERRRHETEHAHGKYQRPP